MEGISAWGSNRFVADVLTLCTCTGSQQWDSTMASVVFFVSGFALRSSRGHRGGPSRVVYICTLEWVTEQHREPASATETQRSQSRTHQQCMSYSKIYNDSGLEPGKSPLGTAADARAEDKESALCVVG